jgi:hypothetical protein
MLYWLNKDFFKRKVYNIKNLKATGELSKTSRPYEPQLQIELPYFHSAIQKLQQKYTNL